MRGFRKGGRNSHHRGILTSAWNATESRPRSPPQSIASSADVEASQADASRSRTLFTRQVKGPLAAVSFEVGLRYEVALTATAPFVTEGAYGFALSRFPGGAPQY
jgi:hypothetical protein